MYLGFSDSRKTVSPLENSNNFTVLKSESYYKGFSLNKGFFLNTLLIYLVIFFYSYSTFFKNF